MIEFKSNCHIKNNSQEKEKKRQEAIIAKEQV